MEEEKGEKRRKETTRMKGKKGFEVVKEKKSEKVSNVMVGGDK